MLPPIARTSDYATSHEGAAAVTVSGRRQTAMGMCLACVEQNPDLTAGEIGEVTGLGHVPAQRRLSDLKNQGKIDAGPPRFWHGHRQVTWRIMQRQLSFLEPVELDHPEHLARRDEGSHGG